MKTYTQRKINAITCLDILPFNNSYYKTTLTVDKPREKLR